MRRAVVLTTVTALALAPALAGCGGGSGGTGSPSGPASGVAADDPATGPVKLTGPVFIHGTKKVPSSGTLSVELDDFYFNPTYLQAAPGQKITLELHNEGQATHTFTAAALGVDVTVYPGRTGKVTLTAPAGKAIQFHCSFHEGQGMQGAIFTKKGQAVDRGATTTTSSSAAPGG